MMICSVIDNFLQANRQLEAEIETTKKTMIANSGTKEILEKQLLDYRGNLVLLHSLKI